MTVTLPAGRYTVSWIDPSAAEVIKSIPIDITGKTELEPPLHEHDILCLVQTEKTE